jgi:SAM-dependent methyltransferase
MFYKLNKDFYFHTYYDGLDLNIEMNITYLLKLNGFKNYPQVEYSQILEAVNTIYQHERKIVDLGCGTGLLLNYIINNHSRTLIPYGIDFIEQSIAIAQHIFNGFKNNFFISNATDIESINIDLNDSIILLDPYHYLQSDLHKIINYCKSFRCRVLLYTYSDVLNILEIDDIKSFVIDLDLPCIYSHKHDLIQIYVV